MTREHRLTVRFDETEISDPRVEARVNHAINVPSTAELTIPNELLLEAKPDYGSAVEVFAHVEGKDHQMFTGFVDTATPGEESKTRIELVTQTQFMSETRMGGLGYTGVPPQEMLWALTRSGGYAPDKIIIQGWEPGPTEVFEIAAAVDGVSIEDTTELGRVRLLPGGPVSNLAEGLGPEELRDSYTESPAWALSVCTAKTLLDAETEGLNEIDFALAWLTTRARYSSVGLPGRQPRKYRREWTLSRVRRKDVVVVRGLSTGRRWLRAPRDIPSLPQLAIGEIGDIRLPSLPPDTPLQLREAINAWRRAAEASDVLETVVALNDALEFYVSNVQLPKLFTKSQKKAIRENALLNLTDDAQKNRVSELLNNMLNEPSLMMKLKKALEDHGVPHTNQELQRLKRVRDKRNAIVHGRSREAPSEGNVRAAVAFVNRMLVYKIAKLHH